MAWPTFSHTSPLCTLAAFFTSSWLHSCFKRRFQCCIPCGGEVGVEQPCIACFWAKPVGNGRAAPFRLQHFYMSHCRPTIRAPRLQLYMLSSVLVWVVSGLLVGWCAGVSRCGLCLSYKIAPVSD